MKFFDNPLDHLVQFFLRRLEAATWMTLIIGALAVCTASVLSPTSISFTVKRQMPLALLTNALCALFILLNAKKPPLNRAILLKRMERGEETSWQILRKHGFLLFGYLNLLFWAGWLMCGLFLILFFDLICYLVGYK